MCVPERAPEDGCTDPNQVHRIVNAGSVRTRRRQAKDLAPRRRAIFTNPRDPYHDFKLKEIYERLERTTDCCEDVADILDSVLLRYS